jgi:hypothetical protein
VSDVDKVLDRPVLGVTGEKKWINPGGWFLWVFLRVVRLEIFCSRVAAASLRSVPGSRTTFLRKRLVSEGAPAGES